MLVLDCQLLVPVSLPSPLLVLNSQFRWVTITIMIWTTTACNPWTILTWAWLVMLAIMVMVTIEELELTQRPVSSHWKIFTAPRRVNARIRQTLISALKSTWIHVSVPAQSLVSLCRLLRSMVLTLTSWIRPCWSALGIQTLPAAVDRGVSSAWMRWRCAWKSWRSENWCTSRLRWSVISYVHGKIVLSNGCRLWTCWMILRLLLIFSLANSSINNSSSNYSSNNSSSCSNSCSSSRSKCSTLVVLICAVWMVIIMVVIPLNIVNEVDRHKLIEI